MVRSTKTKAIYGVALILVAVIGILVALNLLGLFDPAPSKSIDVTELNNLNYKYDVLIMRHELAPGGGDPEGFVLSDCSTQRNLNQEGVQLASMTGKKLSSFTRLAPTIYSSKWCRCLETCDTDCTRIQLYSGRGKRTEFFLPVLHWIHQRRMHGMVEHGYFGSIETSEGE